MLDNPMIRPELSYRETSSLENGPGYDHDEDYLQEVIRKHTDFNMVEYANGLAGQMLKAVR